MTLPSFNYFVGIKLTLALYSNPATTKTVWVINRPNLGTANHPTQLWPILLQTSDFGMEADITLPKPASGNFVLDNSVGSFGLRRKFADLLERYSIHEQTVEVYIDEIALDSRQVNFSGDTAIWKGKVKSYSFSTSAEGSTISINVQADTIPDRKMGIRIDSAESYFADAPNQSIGKLLPITAGDTVVPTYLVTTEEATSASYAYASSIGNSSYPPQFTHQPWGATNDLGVWARDVDGIDVYVTNDDPTLVSGSNAAGSYAFNTNAEHAFSIDNQTENAVIGGVLIELAANGTTGPPATAMEMVLQGTLYEIDSSTNGVTRAIVSGSVDLSDYDTENNAGGTFAVPIVFSKPVVCEFVNKKYAFGVGGSKYVSGTASWKNSNTTAEQWVRDAGTGSATAHGLHWTYSASATLPLFCLMAVYGTTYSSNTAIVNGFAAAVVSFGIGETHNFGNGDRTFSESINWTLFDFLIRNRGLLDDSSGTIFGNVSYAYSPLVQVDWFLQCITQTWSGSAWSFDTDHWDFSTRESEYDAMYASSGRRTRRLQGFIEGDVTLAEMIDNVCRDTATRIGVTNTGKLFPWAWGEEQTVQATIGPEDIIPISWQEADASSVINSVTINYAKSPIDIDITRNIGAAQTFNFNSTISWNKDTKGDTTSWSTNSQSLYDLRHLDVTNTDYIGSDQSAQTLAESYLTQRAYPETHAVFIVPYTEYKDLQIFDVIKFSHPAFPAFYGTDSEDSEPVDDDTTTGRANIKEGHHLYRAKTYRGLIEGRYINLTGAPTIRLIVKVLRNYPKDPT